jgi:ankyrin repeat protein
LPARLSASHKKTQTTHPTQLLAAGADPTAPSSTGHAPLDVAAAASQPAVVRVLTEAVVRRGGPDAAGAALTRAAVRGQVFVAKELLLAGADPNWREPGTGRTPMHWAAFAGDDGLVRALLAAGGEPGLADVTGARPADWAADRGHVALAAALREREAKSPLDRLASGAGAGALIAVAVGAVVGARRMKQRKAGR